MSEQVQQQPAEFSYGALVKSLIFGFVQENRKKIAGYACLLFLGTVFSIVGITKVSAALYKNVSTGQRRTAIQLLCAIIVLSLSVTAINFGIDRLEGYIQPSFRRYVKLHLLEKVFQKNRQRYLDNILPIRYRSFVSATSQSTYHLFSNIIRTYIPNSILLIIMTGFLFYLSWKYGLVFLLCVGICVLIFYLKQNSIVQLSSNAEKVSRSGDAFTFDILSSLQTVVSKDTIKQEMNSIKKRVLRAQNLQVTQNHKLDNMNYTINVTVAVSIFVIMGLAIFSMKKSTESEDPSNGSSTVNILAVLSLMATLRTKLTGLSSTNIASMSHYARGSANQLPELDKIQPLQSDDISQRLCTTNDCPIRVQFNNVGFKYDGQKEFIIRNFNWSLSPGQISVLKAHSGSGKSTLAKLLLRFYAVNDGDIRMNDVPIQAIPLQELRSKISFVNQDIPLLNRSIQECLTYSNNASKSEVMKLWSGVQTYFPNKNLQSKIGRDGSSLSTGQKQLLRIINSVLCTNVKVVIFDEPCSGLNEELRQIVLDLIRAAAYEWGKTVWLITHDSAVAAIGDSVKVLE